MFMVTQFYKLAKKYCTFIDTKTLSGETLEELTALLLQLYLQGLSLPDTASEEPKGGRYKTLICLPFPRLRSALPTDYSMIYDPFAPPEEALATRNLADDLGDIYLDLQEGILAYEAGTPGEACFCWRWGLNNHWGTHLTDALKALHWLRTNEKGK